MGKTNGGTTSSKTWSGGTKQRSICSLPQIRRELSRKKNSQASLAELNKILSNSKRLGYHPVK
jgi:hypothetical protein